MNGLRLDTISTYLAKHLRHRPHSIGVSLDTGGWADIDTLLRAADEDGFAFTRDELEWVVAHNDKRRFAIDGNRIRANQGHSVQVDLGLAVIEPPVLLYHGTLPRNLDPIRAEGLRPMGRMHVHLADDPEIAAREGARKGPPVVLTVEAGVMHRAGHRFGLSANGVWLCGHVPPPFIRAGIRRITPDREAC